MRHCGITILLSTIVAVFLVYAQEAAHGIELYKAKEFAKAEDALRAAVREHPKNGEALYYLGLTLLERGKPAEAAEVLLKADEVTPNDGGVNIALARAYIQQKEFDKAMAPLDRAAKANADGKNLPYYRGMAELGASNFRAAADDFERALEVAPDNAYAHYYAGMAYSRLKQPDKMVTHFQQFVRMAPDAPEAAKVQSVLSAAR